VPRNSADARFPIDILDSFLKGARQRRYDDNGKRSFLFSSCFLWWADS
jgi:hypothetical protein